MRKIGRPERGLVSPSFWLATTLIPGTGRLRVACPAEWQRARSVLRSTVVLEDGARGEYRFRSFQGRSHLVAEPQRRAVATKDSALLKSHRPLLDVLKT